MDIKSVFAALAFLFSIATYVPYTQAVLKSNARPTISAWISWWIVDIAILAGIMASGEMAWQLVAYIVGVIFVLGASIYKGCAGGWTRLDFICLGLVIVAVGLWAVTGNPRISIVITLIAMSIGTIPMLVNVWKNPTREPVFPWILVTIGGLFAVLAVQRWNIAAALTPLWMLALQVLTVGLIFRKYLPKRQTT